MPRSRLRGVGCRADVASLLVAFALVVLPSRPISTAPRHGACLHCRAPLGRNDVLTELPVGRRFAFDSERQRVWIVCLSCRRWCLPVAYALPEAVEACERYHAEAARRIGSGAVSLARHPSGVELIRVGGASRFELAVWRYGDRASAWGRWRAATLGERAEGWLLERRDRLRATFAAVPWLVAGLALGALSSAALAQSMALALVLIAFFRMFTLESELHEKQLGRLAARARVAVGRIAEVGGGSFVLHADQAWRSRVVDGDGPCSWRLSVPARARLGHTTPAGHEVEGGEAVRALRLALAEAGEATAAAATIRAAIDAIERADGAHAFLASASAEAARCGLRYATVGELPGTLRLALQIAADEAHEVAMMADPALLEREWQEADELAALGARVPEVAEPMPALVPSAALRGEPL